MFARTDTASVVDLTPFEERTPIQAVRQLRKLRGGSQASLVECDDGSVRVLKMNRNPQGPNTLANEVLGRSVANAVGLPTASVAPIMVTDAFLNNNPNLAFKGGGGCLAQPGTHLAISFVGDVQNSSSVFQILSPSHVRRIANRECFLPMYLLDIAANHHDHRQALFVREGDIFALQTVFIDHGGMFGGAWWHASDTECLPLHRNPAMYFGLWNDRSVSAWVDKLQQLVPPALVANIPTIPNRWFAGDIARVRDATLRRLERLPQLARQYCLADSTSCPVSGPLRYATHEMLLR